jgi:hypothetical protein
MVLYSVMTSCSLQWQNVWMISVTSLSPNAIAEWLTFLLHFREVPGSNLGLETSYSDWCFSWFSSVPQGEVRVSTLTLGHDRFVPNSFHFIICCCIFYIFYIQWGMLQ